MALVPVEFNGANPQSDIYFSVPPGPWEPRAADTSPAWAAESLPASSEQEGLEGLPDDDPSGTSAGEGTVMASESGTDSWEQSVPSGARAEVGREVRASGKASESVHLAGQEEGQPSGSAGPVETAPAWAMWRARSSQIKEGWGSPVTGRGGADRRGGAFREPRKPSEGTRL